MRKLVLLWMRGELPIRLPAIQTDETSTNLLKIITLIPNEFAHKPRSLREVDRWKAIKFRQLLLYTGPLVLKSIRKKYFTHFLALNCAVRILINQDVTIASANKARSS